MKCIIADANVLIDYINVDRMDILKLYNDKIAEIHIPSTVVEEAEGMDEDDFESLGLAVIDEEVADQQDAMIMSGRHPRLSYQDCLCFILSRNADWFCATSEKALLKFCRENNVSTKRQFSFMRELKIHGHLKKEEVMTVAEAIISSNSRLPQTLLTDFENTLDTQ